MQSPPKAARAATFAYFALNGFVMGMWVVHIPAVEQRAGIAHPVLGWLLLLLGGGAFAGMQLAGRLTDRYGARRIVPVAGVLCSAALVLPGLATDGPALGAALLLLGIGNGVLDVGMNAHAVEVERQYGRPVMAAFHAVFSIGGVLAAVLGAAALARGWTPAGTLTAAALTAAAASVLCGRALLDRPPTTGGPARPGDGTATPATRRRTRTPGRIRALAGLAFVLMLCEGVANDWSVLAVREGLGAAPATAALAYGAFATAMTTGRFLADRAAQRFGSLAVVGHGALLAAAGLSAAALAPTVAVALTGWAVFGVGLSGCVPQLFSAAGHADPAASGTNVSRVAGLGYLGMLAGPAVIGPLTRAAPLHLVLLLPVALCLVAAAAARPALAAPRAGTAINAPA
ncbi:MFS transporter [Kitasatospora paranensis]|uniref:MFS transporter n=2 Tax=Kitasatospora paranensis TaxID=258053 RepID=A0ABW2FQ59_9ACTN